MAIYEQSLASNFVDFGLVHASKPAVGLLEVTMSGIAEPEPDTYPGIPRPRLLSFAVAERPDRRPYGDYPFAGFQIDDADNVSLAAETKAGLFVVNLAQTQEAAGSAPAEVTKVNDVFRLFPGLNVIVLSPAETEGTPAAACWSVGEAIQRTDLSRSNASEIIAGLMFLDDPNLDSVLVAVVDITKRRPNIRKLAGKAGTVAMAIMLAAAAKKDPDLLPVFATIGLMGVGAFKAVTKAQLGLQPKNQMP